MIVSARDIWIRKSLRKRKGKVYCITGSRNMTWYEMMLSIWGFNVFICIVYIDSILVFKVKNILVKNIDVFLQHNYKNKALFLCWNIKVLIYVWQWFGILIFNSIFIFWAQLWDSFGKYPHRPPFPEIIRNSDADVHFIFIFRGSDPKSRWRQTPDFHFHRVFKVRALIFALIFYFPPGLVHILFGYVFH